MYSIDLSIFKDNFVANWHEHVWLDYQNKLDTARCAGLIDAAAMFHNNILICSLPILKPDPSPYDFVRGNRAVHEAMLLYPGILRGMCFVNPGYTSEAVTEIKHCIKNLGMTGLKLYNQYLISDPIQDKIIKTCIDLDVPILVHAGKLKYHPEREPYISDGTHFAVAAKKFPEAAIIMAHIGGGGDWQWSLKAIADSPNISIDISGSVIDEGIIEQSLYYLGPDRILFGTDMSWSGCIGKLLAARIARKDKIRILGNNRFKKYLERNSQL